jgi:hypothetical protein
MQILGKAPGQPMTQISSITSITKSFISDVLPWLEIISIIGKVPLAVQALRDIQQWLEAVSLNFH